MITVVAFMADKFITPVMAVACGAKQSFFFIPPWWEYLDVKSDDVGGCKFFVNGFQFSDVLAVGLAILDILLRIGGFVAIVSIIWSGINYITTQGNAEKAAAARKRLYNALIGLAIVFVATALVTFMGHSLAK